ncbi:hypothetical protein ACO0QE_000948 [Hanseniaspora vineae]
MIRQTENPIEMGDNIPLTQEGDEPLHQDKGQKNKTVNGEEEDVGDEFRVPEEEDFRVGQDDEFRIQSLENEKSTLYTTFCKSVKKYKMFIISVIVITFFIVVDKYSLPPLVSGSNHSVNGTKSSVDNGISEIGLNTNKINGIGQTGIALSGLKLLQYFDNNLDSISARELSARKSKTQENSPYVSSYYYDLFMSFLLSNQNVLSAGSVKKPLVEILTRDVTPLNYVHSHNDYWRTLPVFDALMHGINSIEADIWLNSSYNNFDTEIDEKISERVSEDVSENVPDQKTNLAVGHNKDYLDPIHRNLGNLYINPLQTLLDEVNADKIQGDKLNGLFHTDTSMPTILYIDFKQPELSEQVYNILVNEYLGTPSFQKYLTYKDKKTGEVVFSPVIVILTGDYPRFEDTAKYADFIFLDLDIVELVQNEISKAAELPPAIVVSTSLKKLLSHCQSIDKSLPLEIESFVEHHLTSLNEQELKCMSDSINFVNSIGFKTRIWGVPQYPVYLRNSYWKQLLVDIKSDYLNVDDLDGILSF